MPLSTLTPDQEREFSQLFGQLVTKAGIPISADKNAVADALLATNTRMENVFDSLFAAWPAGMQPVAGKPSIDDRRKVQLLIALLQLHLGNM